MTAVKIPRHKWALHSGDHTAYPPTAVERCEHCGVFTKKQTVTTSRIGVHSATFTEKQVPIYSRDEASWQWDKIVCTGKSKGEAK